METDNIEALRRLRRRHRLVSFETEMTVDERGQRSLCVFPDSISAGSDSLASARLLYKEDFRYLRVPDLQIVLQAANRRNRS